MGWFLMAGYRQWADGDALLPSELDDYLMGQTLMRFASAAARTAAITSPVAGMRSYLEDTGLDYIFDGATWQAMLLRRKKAANQSAPLNSTTFIDDTHLQVTLVPGEYFVDAWLHASGSTTGDIQTRWAFGGTASEFGRMCHGPTRATTNTEGGTAASPVTAANTVGVNRMSTHAMTTAVPYGLDGSNNSGIWEHLSLKVTSGGILKLQWAQETSSGTATTLSSASHIRVERVAAL
jgi:hypothetical protein